MFSRIVPLTAILAILVVAVISFFMWRDAEKDPHPGPAPRDTQRLASEQIAIHAERAELYARQAEAAASRAEAALEALLLIEARLAADAEKKATVPAGNTTPTAENAGQ